MLKIKRIPTVVSNYQEDDISESSSGCGRSCLGKCCLPVSKLPLYAFKIQTEDINSSEEQPPISFLHNLLFGEWEDRMSRGLFHYDVTTCETKILPCKYGFLAQLNEGRHQKKRPTEFRVDQVLQPFDDNKFNFTKVGQEEVLFRFEPNNDKSYFCPSTEVASDLQFPSVVAINVSPIEYGHVLLIPRVLNCLSQRIDPESLLLALHLAKEAADPFFRAYYLAVPFPVEKAPSQRIISKKGPHNKGVIVSQLLYYPVRGLVFEGGNTIRDLSDVVASSCICLQNNNIPFNVLISDCGKRIFLFPQCFAEKQALGEVRQDILDTLVNPAVWEISGHIVLKRRKDFDDASEAYAWRLLSEASLSEDRFQEVKACILEAADLQEANVENAINEEESLYKPPPGRAAPHLLRDCLVHQ